MTQLEMLPRDGDVNAPHRARLRVPIMLDARVLACFACGWWIHHYTHDHPTQHKPGGRCPNCRVGSVLETATITLRKDPS